MRACGVIANMLEHVPLQDRSTCQSCTHTSMQCHTSHGRAWDRALTLSKPSRQRYGLGIVMAEGLLGLAPVGTHTYGKFVTPDELRTAMQDVGLHVDDMRGMWYSPITRRWALTESMEMNYIVAAVKPPGEHAT
eukprot:m.99279 g.99279  ORF g.99279 m.99279 type:complete len:134 (+) comp10302_c0_seq5:990-1391(+)